MISRMCIDRVENGWTVEAWDFAGEGMDIKKYVAEDLDAALLVAQKAVLENERSQTDDTDEQSEGE